MNTIRSSFVSLRSTEFSKRRSRIAFHKATTACFSTLPPGLPNPVDLLSKAQSVVDSLQTTAFTPSSTVIDQDHEVAKFSAQQDVWWDAVQNPLLQMNPVRVEFLTKQFVSKQNTTSSLPLSGLSCLDIGCGGGILAESLIRLGAEQVVALDPSTALIEAAERHAEQHLTKDQQTRLQYLSGITIEDYVLSDYSRPERFDAVCVSEVVEHLPHDAAVTSLLAAASRLVKPDTGRLIVSTMNSTALSYVATIVGAEQVMGYLPQGTHDWNRYLSPTQLYSLLIEASSNSEEPYHTWQNIDIQGMVLTQPPPPITSSWQWKLSQTDTNINWIGAYRKVEAL